MSANGRDFKWVSNLSRIKEWNGKVGASRKSGGLFEFEKALDLKRNRLSLAR